MQLFKSDKPVRLASLSGYVVVIEPDKPGLVPDVMATEAYAAGCVPVDQPLPAQGEELDPEEREAELKAAITALIAKNDAKDFNADGSPRVMAVRKVVSFQASGDEIRAAYEALTHGV